MKTDYSSYEIMAPAGSREAFQAALHAGADSIYLGVDELNMRARSAQKFSLHDLEELAALAHQKGVKLYLALNTVIYDEDYPTMNKILEQAARSNIDAIIAADIAAITAARHYGLSVHISTQQNISNMGAVRFFSQFAETLVLARELSLKQIAAISRTIQEEQITGTSGELLKLEAFAHGAFCMAISGKCFLSLHEENCSANRGECSQVCRHSYEITDTENGRQFRIEDNRYIMSPQDLSTLGFLGDMMTAGISVFKIEGRGRAPEYVRTVVRAYREALKLHAEKRFNSLEEERLNKELKKVFNRDFWEGYYLGRKTGVKTQSPGSKATQVKSYLGKSTNYYGQLGVAEFKLEAGILRKGDTILITGPTTGVIEMEATEIRVDRQSTNEVQKGTFFSIKTDTKIRRADQLFKISPRG